MTKPLAGRRVLVTGGVRRIGRAIALECAEFGADIIFTSRKLDQEADALVELLRSLGVRAFAVTCDVRVPDSVTAAVAEAAGLLGGIDVLVNNAGAFESAALESLDVAQWDAMFETNTRGPLLVAQAAYPHLKAAGGRIIHIGSLGGVKPWATHGHYCASKAALHMLSATMAKAWAPEISVNCVAPGMIVFDDEPGLAAKTPMGRNGTAADVVAAVVFFATAPTFVTGQLLVVDGGLGL